MIRHSDVAHYWGDLHAQTGETQGNNPMEYYLNFARNKAFPWMSQPPGERLPDPAPPSGRATDELTAAADELVALPCCPAADGRETPRLEAITTSSIATKARPIYRCSHALVGESQRQGGQRPRLQKALYAWLEAEPVDAVMYAHVGGRYADIHYAHNAALEAAVGCIRMGNLQWILTSGFPLRRRRGGLAWRATTKPTGSRAFRGASVFGAYGGLICFVMAGNDRDNVFDAIRRRHTTEQAARACSSTPFARFRAGCSTIATRSSSPTPRRQR